jgi:hypothetical protein
MPFSVLDVEKSATGRGDNPASDHFYGSISGSFVCDWLPIIDAAKDRINADRVRYHNAGPNSNTALLYILSQLPNTMSPWVSRPNLTGWYPYEF